MTPSPQRYTETGRLVTDAGKRDWDELTASHGAMYMGGWGALILLQTRLMQHLNRYPRPSGYTSWCAFIPTARS